jgi:hypothetical protein
MPYKYRIYALSIFFSLFLGACSEKKNVYLDNSSAISIEADIDGIRYNITAGESRGVAVKPGVHKISAKSVDGKWIKDTTFQVVKGGIVNLNQGKYTVWRELYGEDSLRTKKLKFDWVNFGQTPLLGDFTRYDSSLIFLEKAWDYDLAEAFPDEKMGFAVPTKEKFIIKAKIYREADLINEYMGMAKTQGETGKTPPPQPAPKTETTPVKAKTVKKAKK